MVRRNVPDDKYRCLEIFWQLPEESAERLQTAHQRLRMTMMSRLTMTGLLLFIAPTEMIQV